MLNFGMCDVWGSDDEVRGNDAERTVDRQDDLGKSQSGDVGLGFIQSSKLYIVPTVRIPSGVRLS
jgi:hypothetical protein